MAAFPQGRSGRAGAGSYTEFLTHLKRGPIEPLYLLTGEEPFLIQSALDRLSEAAVLAGVAFFYVQSGSREEVILCFAALAGSILVSYIRARAQFFGLDLTDGLFTRPERVLVLGGGLIISQVRIALWVLAVMANATALQRLYVVWDRFRRDPPPPEGRQIGRR